MSAVGIQAVFGRFGLKPPAIESDAIVRVKDNNVSIVQTNGNCPGPHVRDKG